ncbi:uncharacterized protein LOC126943765 [Macaca thibetana thibetana]|uniref:uncharacterized protein LOC126943765 n=1 Tax=Macaca thibetana thibetana TaxID=257877 RepID=UPI0021BCEFDA|nr:uncharacterized protein LOC126943765 [Macaca thibetana thibetana]
MSLRTVKMLKLGFLKTWGWGPECQGEALGGGRTCRLRGHRLLPWCPLRSSPSPGLEWEPRGQPGPPGHLSLKQPRDLPPCLLPLPSAARGLGTLAIFRTWMFSSSEPWSNSPAMTTLEVLGTALWVLEFPVNRTQVFLEVQLLSLSILSLEFTHAVAESSSLFLFIAGMHYRLSICSVVLIHYE